MESRIEEGKIKLMKQSGMNHEKHPRTKLQEGRINGKWDRRRKNKADENLLTENQMTKSTGKESKEHLTVVYIMYLDINSTHKRATDSGVR
jgi:hypothetical protein